MVMRKAEAEDVGASSEGWLVHSECSCDTQPCAILAHRAWISYCIHDVVCVAVPKILVMCCDEEIVRSQRDLIAKVTA